MRTRYQSEWVKKKTGEEKKEKKTYLNKLATRSTSSATHIFHSYLINKTKREEEEEDGEGERKKLSAPYDGAVLECGAYCCLHSKHSDRTVNMEFSFFFFYTLSFHTASSSFFFRDAMYGTKKMVKTKQKKKNLTPFESQEKKLEGKMVICCCCDKMNDLLAARLATIYTEYIANRPKRYTLLLSIVLLELPL